MGARPSIEIKAEPNSPVANVVDAINRGDNVNIDFGRSNNGLAGLTTPTVTITPQPQAVVQNVQPEFVNVVPPPQAPSVNVVPTQPAPSGNGLNV